MRLLRVLLTKDLRRVWRNPFPSLVNLALPLLITALVGLAFGGKSNNDALAHVKFAVVDEDNSTLTGMLRGAMNQGDAGKHLEPVFVDRETALRQLNNSELSAAFIIPTNFTRDYFDASNSVHLELIKNPAQSIQPAVLEEGAGALVTGLNTVARIFHGQFPDWRQTFKGEVDFHKFAAVAQSVGDRLEAMKKYIAPPLVGYEKAEEAVNGQPAPTAVSDKRNAGAEKSTHADGKSSSNKTKDTSAAKSKPVSNFSAIFGWVLMGMSAMFLLFIAGNAMTDLQHELKHRTFERYQTMREQLFPFVVSKVLYTAVFALICAFILIGGGGLVFGVHWLQPFALATMTGGYACCAAGIMAVLIALAPDERQGRTISSLAGTILGLAGGCAFPRHQLPHFVSEHVTPLMPSYWYVDAARNLQDGAANVAWAQVSLKLVIVSAVLIGVAVFLFRRRFRSGARA